MNLRERIIGAVLIGVALGTPRSHAQITSTTQIQKQPTRSIRIERYFNEKVQQQKNIIIYRAARISKGKVTWLERPLGDETGYFDSQMTYIDSHVAETLHEIEKTGAMVATPTALAGLLAIKLDPVALRRDHANTLKNAYLELLNSKWLEYVGPEKGPHTYHRYEAIFDFAENNPELRSKIKEIQNAEKSVFSARRDLKNPSSQLSKMKKWGKGLLFTGTTALALGFIFYDDFEKEVMKQPELITVLDFITGTVPTLTVDEMEVVRLKRVLEAVLWSVD